MEEEHQYLDKPNNGVLRNITNTQSRENQQRDLSCYYGLRENPKKKTLKSPESMKKVRFRCEECGKGFRYEKCLTNHQAGMHSPTNQRVYEEEEPMKNLCSSFSAIKKKKRSRVIRYKKTPLSCSFTTVLESRSVSAWNDEELEVAESLILLSKSSPEFVVDGLKLVGEAMDASSPETPNCCLWSKKPRIAGEFESRVFDNEPKLVEEIWKGPARFLRFNNEFDQQRRRNASDSESEQKLLKEETSGDESDMQKLRKGREFGTELDVGAMECSESETESNKMNVEHQCRLCNKIFSSYQALGGHQTYHRMSKSRSKKNCREESVEEHKNESVTVMKEKKRYKCSFCSKRFRSIYALGGHKKSHGKIQHSKTEYSENLGFLSVVPVSLGVEFY